MPAFDCRNLGHPTDIAAIVAKCNTDITQIDGYLDRLDIYPRSVRIPSRSKVAGSETDPFRLQSGYDFTKPVAVNQNTISEGVYQDVRRRFKRFGSREEHLNSVFGVSPNPDYPGEYFPNWYDRDRARQRPSEPSPIDDYIDMYHHDTAKSRAAGHKSNCMREAFEASQRGWFPFLVSLTASPQSIGPIFYDRDHPDYGTHFTGVRRKFMRHVAKTVYGVVDPRRRHDPKYVALAQNIDDLDERKRYLNRNIPTADYFSCLGVCELGSKTGRPHYHLYVFVKDFRGSDPNFVGYKYQLTDDYRYPSGEKQVSVNRTEVKSLCRLWPYGFSSFKPVRNGYDNFCSKKGWQPTLDHSKSFFAAAGYISKYISKSYLTHRSSADRDLPFRVKTTVGFGTRYVSDVLDRLSTRSLYYLSQAQTTQFNTSRDYTYAERTIAPSLLRRLIRKILAKRLFALPDGIYTYLNITSISQPRPNLVNKLRSALYRSIPAPSPTDLPPIYDPEATGLALVEFFSLLRPEVQYNV